MRDTSVPFSDGVAGRLVAGFVNGVSDHPFATCTLLVLLAVAVGLLLLEPGSRTGSEWMDGE